MSNVLDKIAHALREGMAYSSFVVNVNEKDCEDPIDCLQVEIKGRSKNGESVARMLCDGETLITYTSDRQGIVTTMADWPESDTSQAALITEILARLNNRG